VDYRLSKEVMPNDAMRNSFNALAIKIFGLSFENWYHEGYWTKSYIPYTLFHGEKAIANISVNRMEILYQGHRRNYIQLGTVMTDMAYRNQGLSRYIMEKIKSDWEIQCDSMFLFANRSVLDFYPKFGFTKETQYQFSLGINSTSESSKKLDINSLHDQKMLKKYYEKTNPFSKVQVVNNFGLLMFYCISAMKDCVYYSPKYDAVVIAEQDSDILNCFDVFCDKGKNLLDILSSVADGIQAITLKFTPIDSNCFDVNPIDSNAETLFVLNSEKNIFKQEKLLFPSISHT
jgi:hypothetical protein